MILSSADILKILGRNEVIRLSAKLSIVDGRPSLSGREGIYVYVNRFPALDEFEATWTLYIESDEDAGLVIAEIQRILPKVTVQPGLLTTVRTTDFRSESTQSAPEAFKPQVAQVDLKRYEERFQSLVEDVQDQMLLVTSGRPGEDGRDGLDGRDGRDGKDIDATETDLFDLQDVEEGIPLEKGQVLTWDGSKWTNLFVRQPSAIISGGGGGGGGGDVPGPGPGDQTGIPEAPQDGNYYVRQNDKWINLTDALSILGYVPAGVIDGGDFSTGSSGVDNDAIINGGDFSPEN